MRLLQKPDGQKELLNGLSGEAVLVGPSARLRFSSGWGFIQDRDESDQWVPVKNKFDLACFDAGQGVLFFGSKATSQTTWQTSLLRQHVHSFPRLQVSDKNGTLGAIMLNVPYGGQRNFWLLKTVQDMSQCSNVNNVRNKSK